jgi:predicted amidohydrolase YtcJ
MYCLDLILVNGKVITMDADNAEAEAVAMAQGRFCAVGSDEEVRAMAGEGTEIIDLGGKVVLPGFIDCHTHFLQMGISLSYLDLRGLSSIGEVLEKLRERARETEKGAWIVGCRWDESKWKERRYITRFDLDKVTPGNPVMLKRMDGHLWVVNTRGLEAAGIPEGEAGLEKDPSTGEPTGLLRWGAKSFVGKYITPGRAEMMAGLNLAVDEALKCGVTSVNEWGANVPLFREAAASGDLPVRIYMGMVYDSLGALKKLGLSTRFGDDMLKLGPVKMFADGSIGARTAALFEPYDDDSSTIGQLAAAPGDLRDRIREVHAAGSQVAVHAIGDRGIKTLLDALERVLEEHPRDNHRHRIEHAELLNDELMDQIQNLDVVLSVQPNFIGEWGGPGELYEKRVGPRYRRMNPLRELMDRCIPTAFGSDCMPFGPMYGIWSAVNNPVQESRLSLHEAIRCYTLGAAYASFEENVKGSIRVGKLADLVVLASTTLPEDRLKDVPVEMTIIGGRVAYAL